MMDIKRQPFFDQIDWEKLEARKITPPWKPDVKDPTSVVAIAKEFVDDPISPSLREPCLGSVTNRDPLFNGFTYVHDAPLNN